MNEPKDEILKVNELSKNITDGTVHLSCWMTMAQIKEIKAKKVLFQNLNKNLSDFLNASFAS